jgi:hypothetical protein
VLGVAGRELIEPLVGDRAAVIGEASQERVAGLARSQAMMLRGIVAAVRSCRAAGSHRRARRPGR